MDLVSASVEKLEPLPPSGDGETDGGDLEDAQWCEEMEERAQRGIWSATFSLGQYHFCRGNYEKAVKWLEQADQGGSMQAKYQLGVMYYDGLGVREDPAKGFSYMYLVAQCERKKDLNVVPSAQYNVGRAYFQGFGVRQSDEEAAKWWRLAAEKGSDSSSVRAQNTLGMFYARKESLDLAKSFYWHSKAANNGNLESLAAVGTMYLNGQGCDKDEDAGLESLRQSSEGGCMYGTGRLALHYFSTKLFSKAAETAFKVSEVDDGYSILDKQGVAMGCFVLARCLQLGQAVSKSQTKALEYYEKAKLYDKGTVAELHKQLTHGKI